MTPEEFVNNLRESVITDNLNIYQDLFNNTELESVTDQYWKNAIKLFNTLEVPQKEVLFSIIRQVQVDSLSSVLAVLDGKILLKNQNDDYDLHYKGIRLNNDLQDLFLEIEEEDL